jgi:hypothetical protein
MLLGLVIPSGHFLQGEEIHARPLFPIADGIIIKAVHQALVHNGGAAHALGPEECGLRLRVEFDAPAPEELCRIFYLRFGEILLAVELTGLQKHRLGA